VPGAVLRSPGCEAVTDAAGRFTVDCPKGTRTFQVTHPDHLDRTWLVTPPGSFGDQDVGSAELVAVPLGGGLYVAGDGTLDLLRDAPLLRAATATEQRWCMDGTQGDPVDVPTGKLRLLDNHAVDWRLYTLDAEGCAYRMTRANSEVWTFAAERVPVGEGTPRGPGRSWIDLDLEPGDYAIVEWYEGFLVRDDGDRYRGHWLRAGTPKPAPSAGERAASEVVGGPPTAGKAP